MLRGRVAGAAAAGLRRMPRGRWRLAIGGRPHRRPQQLPPRRRVSPAPLSSSPTVAGCRLGGFPVERDWWGGERVVGGVLPRINIGADMWGESNIMTGVYDSGIEFGRSRTGKGSSGGGRRGWCEEWARRG